MPVFYIELLCLSLSLTLFQRCSSEWAVSGVAVIAGCSSCSVGTGTYTTVAQRSGTSLDHDRWLFAV